MGVNHSARPGGIKGIYISLFYTIKVCCMFELESPHRGDSNKYTQFTIFNIKKKIALNCPKSAAIRFFQGTKTKKRVRNSHGKRAISLRATEVLLYFMLSKVYTDEAEARGLSPRIIFKFSLSVLSTEPVSYHAYKCDCRPRQVTERRKHQLGRHPLTVVFSVTCIGKPYGRILGRQQLY